jgi:glycerol-3-phosphate acyltransferase PlsY
MSDPIFWATCIGAYLFGGVPFGVLVARASGRDPRLHGSGNIGATNVGRIAGLAAGALTLILDAAKGFAPVLIAGMFVREPLAASGAAVAAVLGHVYPPYTRFRGGKGVATAAGAFAALSPGASLIAFSVFLLLVAGSRYVSLGSLGGAVTLPIASVWLAPGGGRLGAALFCALLVIVRHRSNLRRLLAGGENRLGSARH